MDCVNAQTTTHWSVFLSRLLIDQQQLPNNAIFSLKKQMENNSFSFIYFFALNQFLCIIFISRKEKQKYKEGNFDIPQTKPNRIPYLHSFPQTVIS